MSGMTVGELRELLDRYDDDTPVRIAANAVDPRALRVHGVAGPLSEEAAGDDGDPTDKVWIVCYGVPFTEDPWAPKSLWDRDGEI